MTAASAERAALVDSVVPFLDEWQGLLREARQLPAERTSAMAEHAEQLRKQAERAAEGGIAHHLEVCRMCLTAAALDRRAFQEALRNLSEVTWQLKQEVGVANGRGPGIAAGVGGSSMAPPPLLLDDPAVPRLEPQRGRGEAVPPPPISLPGVVLHREPPPAHEASFRGQARPEALAFEPSPVPSPRLEPPSLARPPATSEARPAPAILSPRPAAFAPSKPLPAPSPRPQPMNASRERDKPNLMVATMFGLRAFGKNKADPAAPRVASAPGSSAPPKAGLLGLGREPRRNPSEAPAWVAPRADGLPELGTGGLSGPGPQLRNDDLDQRLRQLRDRDEPNRRSQASARSSSTKPSAARRSETPKKSERSASSGPAAFAVPWWLGLVAVGLVGLVVVGVLVFGRSRPPAESQPPAEAVAVVESEIPRSRLLDDKERMRALISQVHSYGGEESPELAELLNEEAALVFDVLEKNCDQPGDKCERAVPVIAGTLPSGAPQHQIHHLFEDRKIDTKKPRAQGGHQPKWLAGLSIPVIGAEDDPDVRRWFEYYTQNEVGREVFKTMLFRCGAYQDLIEKTLLQYGLPRALMALVMTESGCVSKAESPVGARGLWQFMPATARAYHLHVKENVVDERISPSKSTEAGVKFLADLYRKMGSWEFALASYNMGPFGLSARIKRAGGDVTFWDLASNGFLPDETAKYVPRIQAYALILENLARFDFSTAQSRAPEMTADLEVPPGTRLGVVARSAGTSLKDLMVLNPDIVGASVPSLPGGRFMVQVPKEAVFRARTTLEQLLAEGDQTDQCVPSAFDWGRDLFTAKMAAACRAASKKQTAP